jgi:hypothetical protein
MGNSLTARTGLAAGLGLLLTCCISPPGPAVDPGTRSQGAMADAAQGATQEAIAPADPWYQAVSEANQAAQLAAQATTAAQWHQVAGAWGGAVAHLQTIPADDPRQPFTQRKAREYQHNLSLAQQQADQQGLIRAFPALGSDVLDEQVTLYRAYVATQGPPDVLIMGSSRALQGIDPQVLQQALAVEGYPGLRAYNLSVNGATSQVVGFMLRQLLAPDLRPRLVIWAEGSRGFNSARFDRTFAGILDSPGYAAVRDGATLTLAESTVAAEPPADSPPSPDPAAADSATDSDPNGTKADFGTVPATPINAQGFLAVNDQFNPALYYRSFPRVRGIYDDAYRPFRLDGVQTVSLGATTQFLQTLDIPLVFVNLPLSSDYLDSTRLGYERQFQRFLQTQADQGAFVLVDLLEIWRWQSHLFADPSHINRYGAREIARLLATDGRIPWGRLGDE